MTLSRSLSTAWNVVLPGLITALHGIAASAIALALLWGADLVSGQGFSAGGYAGKALSVVGSDGLIVMLAVYLACFGVTGLSQSCDALITTLFSSIAFLLGFLSGLALILLALDPVLGLLGAGGARRLWAALTGNGPIYLAALILFPLAEYVVRQHAGRGLTRAVFILALLGAGVGMILLFLR